MKILVLGAGGMLGHRVCRRLRSHDVAAAVRTSASRYRGLGPLFGHPRWLEGIDVLEGDVLERAMRDEAPDVVVNCIGLVKQLPTAGDPYLAVAINSLLPHRLARICAKLGGRLIHVSTDCVFDGTRGGYRESDPPDARDLYGLSKALGETVPEQTCAVTLRTSFIGHELFAPTHGLVEWFLAERGSRVRGFDRVIYSGLTSEELADVIGNLIEEGLQLSGVYHLASKPISKYDLLVLIRDVYGLDVDIERTDHPVSDRSLVMESFTDVMGYRAPSWETMIEKMYAGSADYEFLNSVEIEAT